jgi:hypothetical protein
VEMMLGHAVPPQPRDLRRIFYPSRSGISGVFEPCGHFKSLEGKEGRVHIWATPREIAQ